jgi:molybdopterin/thiamine biosynthesis adenylyltransferase
LAEHAVTTGDRYSRHRAITGFSQDALQASRFIVVGAGAIGNEVVKTLCLLGVGAIDVFDLDRVELHNLTRSVLLRESDVGRPKAAAVVERARTLDPQVRLAATDGDIRDTLGPQQVADSDFVIGAVDNFEARIWINRLCRLLGRGWVNAAIDHRHASVETFAFPGDTAPCYECALPDSVYARIAERYSCGGLLRAALAERIMPTTAITASLAGALAAQQALQPSDGRRILFDAQTGRSTVATVARRSDCPGCAAMPPPGTATIAAMPAATGTALARWAGVHAAGEPVVLAEPVIWSALCRHCGQTEATRVIAGVPARRVSETATFCFACGSESIAIDLRDQVQAEELAFCYGDARVPLAFVQIGTHLLDLIC